MDQSFHMITSQCYFPVSLLQTLTSILSLFYLYSFIHPFIYSFTFNDSIFIPTIMQSILTCLLQALSYSPNSIGSHLNIHLRADLIKSLYSVYLPSKPDDAHFLSSQPIKASDILLGDSQQINFLLHILIQLFAEVEKVGLESSQYRKYIIAIIRILWNDSRCVETVQNMVKEHEILLEFAKSLITSFSKLTDDAFAAIPEIKQLTAEMLTPEFSRLEESDRESKQLRLSQLEQSVRFSFDLVDETLELLLQAAEPWKVYFKLSDLTE